MKVKTNVRLIVRTGMERGVGSGSGRLGEAVLGDVRPANGVAVGVSVAVEQELLCGEPVLQLHALKAAAVDPELIRLMLDFCFGGLGGRRT